MFDYNAASDTFTPGTTAGTPPQGNDAKCGFACHTRVKTRDYVFTEDREAVNDRAPSEWIASAARSRREPTKVSSSVVHHSTRTIAVGCRGCNIASHSGGCRTATRATAW